MNNEELTLTNLTPEIYADFCGLPVDDVRRILKEHKWTKRGSFNVEELAVLCMVRPVTIRRWRSTGRGGVKLLPTDTKKRTDKSDLFFSSAAVNEFYSVNDDLQLSDELIKALEDAARAQHNSEKRKNNLSSILSMALAGGALLATVAAMSSSEPQTKALPEAREEDESVSEEDLYLLQVLKERLELIDVQSRNVQEEKQKIEKELKMLMDNGMDETSVSYSLLVSHQERVQKQMDDIEADKQKALQEIERLKRQSK